MRHFGAAWCLGCNGVVKALGNSFQILRLHLPAGSIHIDVEKGVRPVGEDMAVLPVQHQQQCHAIPGGVIPLPQGLRHSHGGGVWIQAVLAHIVHFRKNRLPALLRRQLHGQRKAAVVEKITVQISAFPHPVRFHHAVQVEGLQEYVRFIVIGAGIFLFQQVQAIFFGDILQRCNHFRGIAGIDIPIVFRQSFRAGAPGGLQLGGHRSIWLIAFPKFAPRGIGLLVCPLQADDAPGGGGGFRGNEVSFLVIVCRHVLPGDRAQRQVPQLQHIGHGAAHQQQAQGNHRGNQQKLSPGTETLFRPALPQLPGFQQKISPDIPDGIQQIHPCHSNPSFFSA